MILDADTLERGLCLFDTLIGEDQVQARALEASWESFPGLPGDTRGRTVSEVQSRRRHLEWYLFELGGADALLATWRERADPELRPHAAAFMESEVGLFLVKSVEPDGATALEEVAGLGSFFLETAGTRVTVAPGDLIVGRLFPVGEGRHRSSPVAGVFRSEFLLEAIRADLDRMREERAQTILRISQAELETMFWGRGAVPEGGGGAATGKDAEVAAQRCLELGGLEPQDARELVGLFRALPYDPERLTPGVDDPLAAALERLAFETDVDLNRARVLLLEVWTQSATTTDTTADEPGSSTDPGGDPARALEAFDQARRTGVDVQSSITALEHHLGLGEDDDEDEVEHEAPDFPGVVAAMVEEFLWDIAREDGQEASLALEPVRMLGEFAGHVGVFENLGARDLLTFCAFWSIERGGITSASEARALLTGVGRFCAWAETHHDLPLVEAFGADLEELGDSLPRAAAANGALGAASEGTGEVWELVELTGSKARIASGGGSTREVCLPTAVETHLRSGDVLRAEVDEVGAVRLFRCYPPQARALLCTGGDGAERN